MNGRAYEKMSFFSHNFVVVMWYVSCGFTSFYEVLKKTTDQQFSLILNIVRLQRTVFIFSIDMDISSIWQIRHYANIVKQILRTQDSN